MAIGVGFGVKKADKGLAGDKRKAPDHKSGAVWRSGRRSLRFDAGSGSQQNPGCVHAWIDRVDSPGPQIPDHLSQTLDSGALSLMSTR